MNMFHHRLTATIVFFLLLTAPMTHAFIDDIDSILGGVERIVAELASFDFNANVNVKADIQVRVAHLKESCEILRAAAGDISRAAERASGNLKTGMESLARSLNQIAGMPDKLDQIMGRRIPELEASFKSSIAEARQSAQAVVAGFHEGNRANILMASQEFGKNIRTAGHEARLVLEETRRLAHDVTTEWQSLMSQADSTTKARLEQLDQSLRNRLQDVQAIVRDTDQRFQVLLENVDQKVQGWQKESVLEALNIETCC